MASRPRTVHRCTSCGAGTPQWSGRCAACGEWNTLVEEHEADRHRGRAPGAVAAPAVPVPIGEPDDDDWRPRPTGLGEVDRVLSGGLVPGSVTLLGGEPGIGKSTLLLQVLGSMAAGGGRGLLVSAEESRQQVRLRARRLGVVDPRVLLLAETSLPAVVQAVEDTDPDCLVVDSIQTVHDPELGSAPGSVAQVRDCAHQLVRLAKGRGMAAVLVGHVTKDGALAGPRVLEHVVDTVLAFEGDRHHALRMLRAAKHRFGSTGELGLFEMGEAGLTGVPDPSALFLGDRMPGVPGSVVVPALEGHRALLVEVQALLSTTDLAIPRRWAQGLDPGRLSLVLAVLAGRACLPLGKLDVHTSAVGGVRVVEPAADLAVALAVASAHFRVPLPPGLVACGEIGLAGEVRQVAQTSRRLAEAARLGFTDAVVPASSPAGPRGMRLHRVAGVAELVSAAGLERLASAAANVPAGAGPGAGGRRVA